MKAWGSAVSRGKAVGDKFPDRSGGMTSFSFIFIGLLTGKSLRACISFHIELTTIFSPKLS
jgi:hypothetical protein